MPSNAIIEAIRKPIRSRDLSLVYAILKEDGPISVNRLFIVFNNMLTHNQIKYGLDKIRLLFPGVLNTGEHGYTVNRDLLHTLPIAGAERPKFRPGRRNYRKLPPFT